jgi:NAD-dependent dihydropyrimidine dehydrogenase PreA subunit
MPEIGIMSAETAARVSRWSAGRRYSRVFPRSSRSIRNEEIVLSMTYVITSPCVGLKDGSCVDVCPVDCIHPAEGESDYEDVQQLFINPDECIDCGACEPACPVSAIFEESAVPANEKQYIQINVDYFKNR